MIKGLDGLYFVMGGQLVKVVGQEHSENWFFSTGGWIKYFLENGVVLKIGS